MKKKKIELLLTGITVIFSICFFLTMVILGNTTEGWTPVVPVMVAGITVEFALCALMEHFDEEDHKDEI